MSVAEAVESVPPSANGEDESVDIPGLGRQMRLLLTQQAQLTKRVQENTSHVLKLHQMHDPLTWKKRAAIMFAGMFAGAFAGVGTAAFFLHATVSFASR